VVPDGRRKLGAGGGMKAKLTHYRLRSASRSASTSLDLRPRLGLDLAFANLPNAPHHFVSPRLRDLGRAEPGDGIEDA